MDMQPIDPNRPMNTTLTAQEWNIVIAALREVPMAYRISDPIINSLSTQLQAQASGQDDGFAENSYRERLAGMTSRG